MGCSMGRIDEKLSMKYNASAKESSLFKLLGLAERDINLIYNIFFDIDKDHGGGKKVRLTKLASFLDIKVSTFFLRTLSMLHQSGKRCTEISFSQFVCICWNLCTCERGDLVQLIFELYDKGGRNFLGLHEINTLFLEIYGENYKELDHVARILEILLGRREISLDMFYQATSRHPTLIQPAAAVQNALIRDMNGVVFWKGKQKFRKKYFGDYSGKELNKLLSDVVRNRISAEEAMAASGTRMEAALARSAKEEEQAVLKTGGGTQSIWALYRTATKAKVVDDPADEAPADGAEGGGAPASGSVAPSVQASKNGSGEDEEDWDEDMAEAEAKKAPKSGSVLRRTKSHTVDAGAGGGGGGAGGGGGRNRSRSHKYEGATPSLVSSAAGSEASASGSVTVGVRDGKRGSGFRRSVSVDADADSLAGSQVDEYWANNGNHDDNSFHLGEQGNRGGDGAGGQAATSPVRLPGLLSKPLVRAVSMGTMLDPEGNAIVASAEDDAQRGGSFSPGIPAAPGPSAPPPLIRLNSNLSEFSDLGAGHGEGSVTSRSARKFHPGQATSSTVPPTIRQSSFSNFALASGSASARVVSPPGSPASPTRASLRPTLRRQNSSSVPHRRNSNLSASTAGSGESEEKAARAQEQRLSILSASSGGSSFRGSTRKITLPALQGRPDNPRHHEPSSPSPSHHHHRPSRHPTGTSRGSGPTSLHHNHHSSPSGSRQGSGWVGDGGGGGGGGDGGGGGGGGGGHEHSNSHHHSHHHQRAGSRITADSSSSSHTHRRETQHHGNSRRSTDAHSDDHGGTRHHGRHHTSSVHPHHENEGGDGGEGGGAGGHEHSNSHHHSHHHQRAGSRITADSSSSSHTHRRETQHHGNSKHAETHGKKGGGEAAVSSGSISRRRETQSKRGGDSGRSGGLGSPAAAGSRRATARRVAAAEEEEAWRHAVAESRHRKLMAREEARARVAEENANEELAMLEMQGSPSNRPVVALASPPSRQVRIMDQPSLSPHATRVQPQPTHPIRNGKALPPRTSLAANYHRRTTKR